MRHLPSLRILCWLVCSTLFAVPGLSHEDHPAVAFTEEDAYRPTPRPDRVVLTWRGDPARSQTVTWRTDTSISRAWVEVAEATPGPAFADHAKRTRAETSAFESDLGEAHYHSATLQPLRPATKYAYRVGGGDYASEWFHFTTASDRPQPFSFIYFGDAQNDIREHWSRVIREAHSEAPRASFMLHAGDLVNRGNRDLEWGEWFAAGSWLNAMIPSIATPGNHEYGRNAEGRRAVSAHWRPQFGFPDHAPEGLEETVYWIDYQGARIISLNSNEQETAQVEWLSEVLEENPNRWTIITFHHPLFSSARGRDNRKLRELWKPVFDKYQVDLVLQGHDHSYARTGLEVPENLDTGANVRSGHTVYVVSVSGPKMYQVDQQEYFSRTASGTQLYQIITVDGDSLYYKAHVATGEVYDAFTLVKTDDGPNKLMEQAPDSPELHQP